MRYLDLVGHWRVEPSTEELLREADVVFTHEFGDQIHPSKTTRQIVRLGASLSRRFEIPLICQSPGNLVALTEAITPHAVIRENLLSRVYLDTHEVNRQLAQICSEQGWRKAILCTHKHHLWRAAANLRRHGMEVMIADVSNVRYDPRCPWRLSSPLFFVPYEIGARFYYYRKGWL